MTPDDVKVVFSNTEELAVFADAFAERIETALGDALEASDDESSGTLGEEAEDRRTDAIGELFLEVVSFLLNDCLLRGIADFSIKAPIMKRLYTTYITRHPLALSRLTLLTSPGPDASSAISPDAGGSTPNGSRRPRVSPEMTAYLAKTRTMTERHTHAWDLPSLLIKARDSTLLLGISLLIS